MVILRKVPKLINLLLNSYVYPSIDIIPKANGEIYICNIQVYAGHAKPDTTMQYVMVQQERVKSNFMKNIA